MKKTLLLLAFFVLSAVMSADNTAASAKSRVELKIVEKPVIDGFLNESIKTPPIELNPGSDELSARIYLGHTPQGLYVFADVKDDVVYFNTHTDGNIWNGDGIEILMSSNANEDPGRTSFSEKDNRIAISANEKPFSWDYRLNTSASAVHSSFRKTDSGYVIEALIPWRLFRKGCSCKLYNKPVKFDVAVNDADSAMGKDFHIKWRGDYSYSVSPSQWGEALLSTK